MVNNTIQGEFGNIVNGLMACMRFSEQLITWHYSPNIGTSIVWCAGLLEALCAVHSR